MGRNIQSLKLGDGSLEKKKLERLFKRLKEEKNVLTQQIENIEHNGIEDNITGSTSELSLYDNHPADIGSELFDRSKDIALKDNDRILLREVEGALDRLASGTYGKCIFCGKLISIERLEAIPWAKSCMECIEKDQHTSRTRPIEESFLQPPFQRSFTGENNENSIGFDGEDSLQAVMKYGSSDSPQDIISARDYKNLSLNSEEHQGIVESSDAIPNAKLNKKVKAEHYE